MERRHTGVASNFEDDAYSLRKLASIEDSRELLHPQHVLFINGLSHFYDISLRNYCILGPDHQTMYTWNTIE